MFNFTCYPDINNENLMVECQFSDWNEGVRFCNELIDMGCYYCKLETPDDFDGYYNCWENIDTEDGYYSPFE